MKNCTLALFVACFGFLVTWNVNVSADGGLVSGIIKCPGRCEYSPCACCEDNLLERCSGGTCHANGCDQCNNGLSLFRVNHNYYCEYCEEIFGDACNFCQKDDGCAQCKESEGYQRTYDDVSMMWYCKPTDEEEDFTLLECATDDTEYPDHDDPFGVCSTPTFAPTTPLPTGTPSGSPTDKPTDGPTASPTDRPTDSPTDKPTGSPTDKPSDYPTRSPTDKPTDSPTDKPTRSPTGKPTRAPTDKPTKSPTDKPTDGPTRHPTSMPTDGPTDKPTRSPTGKPTESPTSKPTKSPTDKPTDGPTRSPTVKPTDSPTDKPTGGPTRSPTSKPTGSPTDDPTDSPTDKPTGSPTDQPTHDTCPYDHTFATVYIVSTGCVEDAGHCDAIEAFLTDLVEKTFADSFGEQFVIVHDDPASTIGLGLTRQGLLDGIDSSFSGFCNGAASSDTVDYENNLQSAVEYLNAKEATYDELKVVMINYCGADSGDATCDVPATYDTTDDVIEYIVINLGDDTDTDQFACLTDSGDDTSDNYVEIASIDTDTLMGQTDGIADRICEQPTPRPTDSPTDKPTGSPTEQPTESPTDKPTKDPSGSPTDSPTDKPTGSPTDQPTHDTCPYEHTFATVYIVSTGCIEAPGACDAIEAFLTDLVEKTFDASFGEQFVIMHADPTSTIGLGLGRQGVLDEIESAFSASCNNAGSSDDVDYDSSLQLAVEYLSDAAVTYDELKVVMINYCGPDSGDATCDVPATYDTTGGVIEYIVINLGDDTDTDQFACLTDSGDDTSDNYVEIPTIDTDTLMDQTDSIADKVCEQPTPRPTNSPTDKPSGSPTGTPTRSPTDKPTGSPTDDPTDSPTDKPTGSPTDQPTHDTCPYDHTFATVYIVSTGCVEEAGDCDAIEAFLTDLVEKTFDGSFGEQFVIMHGDPTSTIGLGLGRQGVLDAIESAFSASCNNAGSSDVVDYDGSLQLAVEHLSDAAATYDELKVVMINYCGADTGDATCDVPATYDTTDDVIEYIVINLGDDTDTDQFACLTDSGDDTSDNYVEIASIDTDTLMGQTDSIADRICEQPTPRPTESPTDRPTKSPTDKPTRSPTDRPTEEPSREPSPLPTDGGFTTDDPPAPTAQPTKCDIPLDCPVPCPDDPCDCEDAGECIQNTCHPNGCDQCYNGNFKKDYNYPCVGCTATFGEDCMHCTDFLGCQQCDVGIRTYDPECGLYYCDDGSCDGPATTSGTSTGPDPTTTSGSSTGPDTTVSGGGTGRVTPPPSRSPTEEPEDETTVAGPDCTDGYIVIDDVDDGDYASSVEGSYYESNYTLNGMTIYTKDGVGSSDNNPFDLALFTDGADNILLYDPFTASFWAVEGATNWNDLVGDVTLALAFSETFEDNPTVNAVVTVYDCDDNLITVPDDSCDADCIVVSDFDLSEAFAGEEQEVIDAFNDVLNGEYCFDDSCDCYSREVVSGSDYGYFIVDSNTGLVSFSYESATVIMYQVDYSVAYDPSLYDDDFACQDIIDSFIRENGTWTGYSEKLETDEVELSSDPTLTFDDCLGVDFYCPFDSSSGMARSTTLLAAIAASAICLFAL